MQAVIWTRPGPADVLQIAQVADPQPKQGEILVRVHAGTVTAGDVFLRRLSTWLWLPLRLIAGLKRKRIPGHEFAGQVEALGKDVSRFRVGDRVFGTTTGLATGGNAELVCVPENGREGVIETMPANMTFVEAAAVPIGAMTAVQILRRAGLRAGQRVLIYGASGSVGTFAVQWAKRTGAAVTGVCSAANADLVRSLGAQQVIDYTQEDFTRSGRTYDIVFDTVGKISAARSKPALTASGIFVTTATSTHESREDLEQIRAAVEAGKLLAVIDRCYRLEQIADAHRYVESGRKRGAVVVVIRDELASRHQEADSL